MTVLHSGSTKKYASGWENVFAGRGARGVRPSAAPTIKKPSATKKAAGVTKHAAAAGKRRPVGKKGKRG